MMVGLAIPHSASVRVGYPRNGGNGRRLLSPRRARPCSRRNPAAYAGAGKLQAGVVRLYRIIVMIGGGVHVGCARLSGVHEAPPRGSGPGVFQHLRGHSFFRRPHHIISYCVCI